MPIVAFYIHTVTFWQIYIKLLHLNKEFKLNKKQFSGYDVFRLLRFFLSRKFWFIVSKGTPCAIYLWETRLTTKVRLLRLLIIIIVNISIVWITRWLTKYHCVMKFSQKQILVCPNQWFMTFDGFKLFLQFIFFAIYSSHHHTNLEMNTVNANKLCHIIVKSNYHSINVIVFLLRNNHTDFDNS